MFIGVETVRKRKVIERVEIKLSEMVGIETKMHHLRRYQFVSQFLKNSDTVLDICSGTGYGSATMADSAKLVHGMEINPTAVAYAKKYNKAPNLKFSCSDVTKINHISAYNVVTMFECLDHLSKENGLRIIKLIGRQCKGMFFASLPENQLFDVNAYHLAEWSIEELKTELQKYFDRVIIFGQAWNSGVISFPYDERRAISVIVAFNGRVLDRE